MLNVFLCHKFETLFSMDEEKRKRVFRIYNWARIILFVLLLTFIFVKLVKAQTTNDFGVWVAQVRKRVYEIVGFSESAPNFAQRITQKVLLVGG